MAEIKLCPFCGSKASAFSEPYGCAHNGENVWRAWCGCSNDMCEAGFELFWYGDDLLDESDDDYTCNALMERAIKRWNRRANERDRDALIDVCREIEDADVDGCIDWADRIRRAIGEDAS